MDPEIDFAQMYGQFDTLLMGRKTFELMQSQGSENPFGNIRIVVCSRTLRADQHPGVTLIKDNLTEAVTALKHGTGRDIALFGGGDLFRSLALGTGRHGRAKCDTRHPRRRNSADS